MEVVENGAEARMKVPAFLFVIGSIGAVSCLFAQQPYQPPAVLRIVKETLQEGKGGAHRKTEGAFMQAAAKAKYPAHIVALTSITGTAAALFLEGHPTIASISESQAILDRPEFANLDAADAGLRTTRESIIAVYRPDLSYAAGRIDMLKMRYFSIETLRTAAGKEPAFVDFTRRLLSGAAKSAYQQPAMTFEVVSGAADGTFLVMEPMASLRALDEKPEGQRAMRDAAGMGGAEFSRQAADSIAEAETIIYAIDPAMSYVPEDWTTGDFWKSAAK
jgi:hypothetical protein